MRSGYRGKIVRDVTNFAEQITPVTGVTGAYVSVHKGRRNLGQDVACVTKWCLDKGMEEGGFVGTNY